METACLRHTEIPHTSRLFSDFQYHFNQVSRFYAHNPFDRASYAAVAGEMAFPADRRERLVAALRAKNGDRPALDLLARPETVAVVTGQHVRGHGGVRVPDMGHVVRVVDRCRDVERIGHGDASLEPVGMTILTQCSRPPTTLR